MFPIYEKMEFIDKQLIGFFSKDFALRVSLRRVNFPLFFPNTREYAISDKSFNF